MYTGEIISLIVALSWTVTAICFEYAGKRIGALTLNIVRLMMSIAMLAITLKLTTGSIAPWDAGWDAWKWLVLSGFVGYVFGDFCLFNSYLLIGSRFGQLFMTLAPPTAAIAGYLFFSVILEYNLYPFIIRTLGGLSDFEVTNCQPFLLLHSALICFLGISSMLQNVLKFAVLSLTSAIVTESI